MTRGIRLCISILLLCVSVPVVAQKREITAEAFQAVEGTASALLSSRPYRVTTTSKTFSGSQYVPDEVRIWAVEFAPPDREHHFFGLHLKARAERSEKILIGPTVFKKAGNGPWEEVAGGSGGMGFSAGTDRVKYFSNGTAKIDGRRVSLYIAETWMKVWIGPERQQAFNRTTYWIGPDGRFLRVVHEGLRGDMLQQRQTDVYTYNARIKIEAPIKQRL